MNLSAEDGKLFFKCWFPLLNYVNKQRKVVPELHTIGASASLDLMAVKAVANTIWAETGLIDSYLEEHKEICDAERELISGWKRCVSGRFVLERILKKGAIFISLEDKKVYRVLGITSSWEQMFGRACLPLLMDATLIPFGDGIISDGLFRTSAIAFGRNMTDDFKDIYMEAKKTGSIHTNL